MKRFLDKNLTGSHFDGQSRFFSTLEAICKTLDCQPGDILEYKGDEDTQ